MLETENTGVFIGCQSVHDKILESGFVSSGENLKIFSILGDDWCLSVCVSVCVAVCVFVCAVRYSKYNLDPFQMQLALCQTEAKRQ